jgi:hypothetical protein
MVFSYKNKFIIIFYILVRILSLTFHQNPLWERCICIQNISRNELFSKHPCMQRTKSALRDLFCYILFYFKRVDSGINRIPFS